MKEIIIVVRERLVRNVYSNPTLGKVSVEVLDYDSIVSLEDLVEYDSKFQVDLQDERKRVEMLEKEIVGMKIIW